MCLLRIRSTIFALLVLQGQAICPPEAVHPTDLEGKGGHGQLYMFDISLRHWHRIGSVFVVCLLHEFLIGSVLIGASGCTSNLGLP